MTTKLEQAARQALLYLEAWQNGEEIKLYEIEDTITALREALAEQSEQEPVAEVFVRPLRGDQSQPTTDIKWLQRPTAGKLYAAPVRTKDLTDDEIHKAFYSKNTGLINGIRAVIAADRAKNNLCERMK